MNQYKLFRSCPICSSKSASIIQNVEFMLYDAHPMQGGYDVVQCIDCGFVFANTKLKQEELDIYYTDLSKYEDKSISTGGGYTKYDRDRLHYTASYLSKHFPNKSLRILDLGCANGGLLNELKKMGYTNIVGVDPSSTCVNIVKNEVQCECYQYSLFDIGSEVGKFDLIILSHVLEHLLDIQSTINLITNFLNSSGYVYVECPDAANYDKVIHAPFQEFNTEHINHFTDKSFNNLFIPYNYSKIDSGKKILKIASGQDYYACYSLFRKNEEIKSQFKNHHGSEINYDNDVRKAIDQYVCSSRQLMQEADEKINQISIDKKVALYGIGQLSYKLLCLDSLKRRKNMLLFDNNSLNIGKRIENFGVVISGKEIVNEYKKEHFTILITSKIHENPIRNSIMQLFEASGMIEMPEIVVL